MVANMVDGKSLTAVKADDELPVLPVQLLPCQPEPGTLRLSDNQRFRCRALREDTICGVISGLRRKRAAAIVLHPKHPHSVQIDDRTQTLQRTGIPIFFRITAQEA